METNITVRWEKGIPHHPKSIEIFKALEENDFKYGGDYFCFKSGGDGDNGEHLMYLLDIYFESENSGVCFWCKESFIVKSKNHVFCCKDCASRYNLNKESE